MSLHEPAWAANASMEVTDEQPRPSSTPTVPQFEVMVFKEEWSASRGPKVFEVETFWRYQDKGIQTDAVPEDEEVKKLRALNAELEFKLHKAKLAWQE